MLIFTPPQKPYTALLFSASCVAVGLILFALSAYIAHRYLLLPIAAATLILLGIWFLYRFAILSYRYEIRSGVLCVIRRIFGHDRTVFTLDLHMGFTVVPYEDRAARSKLSSPRRIHNFVVTWPTEHAVLLYYHDAAYVCAVILEDNPAFFTAASKYFSQNTL